MGAVFSYVLLGVALGAPIGPVNAAQITKGLAGGFLRSWLVGIGDLTADIFYMLLVYLGMVHFIQIPLVKAFLWSFGCFVLFYTGFEAIVQAGRIASEERSSADTLFRSYVYGFMISIANPLTILFWLGIFGSVLAKTMAENTTPQILIYSLAVIFGLILWDFFMALVASSFRRLLTNKALVFISWISGLSLIGFGVYFGYQAYIEIASW